MTISVSKEKEKDVEQAIAGMFAAERIQAKILAKNSENDLRSRSKVTLIISLSPEEEILKTLGNIKFMKTFGRISASFVTGSLVGLIHTRRDWEAEDHIMFDWEEGFTKIQAQKVPVEQILTTPATETPETKEKEQADHHSKQKQ